jgi:hypothetical protein
MARILLGVPCSPGACWSPATAFAITQASKKHHVAVLQPIKQAWDNFDGLWKQLRAIHKFAPGLASAVEGVVEVLKKQTTTASVADHSVQAMATIGSWFNFQMLWATALNAGRKKEQDRFVMLHSDIELETGFADILEDTRGEFNADFLSAIVPQKEATGLTSSGIGDDSDPWTPHQRFTVKELFAEGAPDTFSFDDCGLPGKYVLHNTGCWIADLTCPKFYETEARGDRIWLKADFDRPSGIEEVVVNNTPEFVARGESEDWFFSRQIHKLGIRSFITRRLALNHMGQAAFPNSQPWGTLEHDEQTRSKWGHAIADESGNTTGATC